MGVIKIKNFTEVSDIFIKSKSDAMVFVVSDNFNNYYAVLLTEFNPSAGKSICTHIIRLIDTTSYEYNLLYRTVCISFEEYIMQFKMASSLYYGSIRCENIYIPCDIISVDSLFKGFNDVGISINTNHDNIKIFNYEYSSILAEYSYKIKEENKRHNEKIKDIRNDIERRAQKILQAKSKKTIVKNEIADDEISIFDILYYIKNIFNHSVIDERMIKEFYKLVKGKTYAEIYKKYSLTPVYLTKLNREIFAKRGMPLGTRICKNK